MILVTGATGHLGNVLIRQLLNKGRRVRALVLPGEDRTALRGLDVECVTGNVLDPASLGRAMRGVDIVYHLAGIVSIMPGVGDLMRRVNVDGVRNVAQAALDAGVGRVVHTSSVHAFERMPQGVVIDETVPLIEEHAAGLYDLTKALGTRAMLQAVRRGLDAVIVCPTGVVGPYDFNRSEMGQTLLGFARRKLQLLVDGAYDFVDVRDVARSTIQAGRRGRTGEIYILPGTQVRLVNLLRTVEKITGRHTPHWVVPITLAKAMAKLAEPFYRLTNMTPQFTSYSLKTIRGNSQIDGGKAQRELGHDPRPLYETVADTLRWLMRSQRAAVLPL